MRLGARGPAAGLLLAALAAATRGAEIPPPRPKGATVLGIVCGRAGACVVIALSKGAAVEAGQELPVGRPRLLLSIATPKGPMAKWGDWHEAGRVRVRLLPNPRYALALIVRETARPMRGLDAPPNIRPGDVVYRPPEGAPGAARPD